MGRGSKLHYASFEQCRSSHALQMRNRSVIPTQTCLNRLKADFLLRRGRFHRALASAARAFLSTG